MNRKDCILYDRPCSNCGECLRCDLDPDKICDNCGACLDESGEDFASILITQMENPESGMMQTLRPSDAVAPPEIHHHHHDDDCDCGCGHEHHHHDDEPKGFSRNLSHPS